MKDLVTMHHSSAVGWGCGEAAYGASNTLDRRLTKIEWLNATNGVFSKFNYEYNANG